MRILYDHQIFAFQKYGGISRYYYEIANRIAAAGNEVEIFAPLYVNEYFRNNCRVRPWGIKIPRLPRMVRVIVKAVNLPLSYLLIKQKRSVDVFHETYYSMFDCCPPSAKRVITVYDMIHEKFPGNFPKRDRTRQLKAAAVRRADHIICISENTRRDIMTLLGISEEKISVIYLGYSLAVPHNVVKLSTVQKPYILYVGPRNGYKNFSGLLRAYGRSRSLKNELSIVCFGGGGFSAAEKALMESLNIPQEKILYVSGADGILSSLYSSASVFVYPSLYEGFGIPPLEAMSFGCPVVCSNTSSIPEVVGNAARLFDPESESDLRAAMEKVVFSSEFAARLAAMGLERIKMFSWEKCANDTMSVYEKVLGINR